MKLPIENKAAREILFNRILRTKDKDKKAKLQTAWCNGYIEFILTDYKEMLSILTVEDFLSVAPIKQKGGKK